jgi:hypothetical protein
VVKYTLPEELEERNVTAPDVAYDIEVEEKFHQNYIVVPEDSYLQSLLILDEIDIKEYTEVVNAVKEARALQQLSNTSDVVSAELNAFCVVPLTKPEFSDLDYASHLPDILIKLQGRIRIMVDQTNVKTIERQVTKRSLEHAKKTTVIAEELKVFVRFLKALAESTEEMNKTASFRPQSLINIGITEISKGIYELDTNEGNASKPARNGKYKWCFIMEKPDEVAPDRKVYALLDEPHEIARYIHKTYPRKLVKDKLPMHRLDVQDEGLFIKEHVMGITEYKMGNQQ